LISRVVSAVQIIDVDILEHAIELAPQVIAARRVLVRCDVELVPVPDAARLGDTVHQVPRDQVEIEEGLGVEYVGVNHWIGVTITDDKAGKVVGVVPVIHLLDQVPLVDLP
jgi:hypothetical protein